MALMSLEAIYGDDHVSGFMGNRVILNSFSTEPNFRRDMNEQANLFPVDQFEQTVHQGG